MACQNCAKIRSAILHGKMAEAAGLTVTALREKIGFVENRPSGGHAPDAAAVAKDVPEEVEPLSGKITAKPKK